MTDPNYPTLSTDELLTLFRNACLRQDDTYLTDDTESYKNDFEILLRIKAELKARGPDARRSLLQLFGDDNPHVRLQAAKFVYPVAPEPARAMLEEIKAMKIPDQSLSAGMALRRLAEAPNCLDD
jgi:hypothetical protein